MIRPAQSKNIKAEVMMKFATLFFATLFALHSAPAFCQDGSVTKSDAAAASPADATKDAPADDAEASEEPKADPITEIKDLVTEKKYDAAVAAMESAAENDPKSKSLQRFRESLAGRLYRVRKYDQAFGQVEKRMEYMIANIDNEPTNDLVRATMIMRAYATRARKADRAMELIDEAMAAVEKATKGDADAHVKAMGLMVPLKASQLAMQSTPEKGRALLKEYLAKLETIEVSSEETRLVTKGKYLGANMSIPNASSADRDMLDEFLVQLRDSHADSETLMSESVRLELSAIRGTYRTNPEYANTHVKLLKSTWTRQT